MFTPDEWREFLDALIAKTSSDAIKWKAINDDTAVQFNLDKDTAVTLASVDGDDRPPFSLVIWKKTESSDVQTESTAEKFKKFAELVTGQLLDQWGNPENRLDELNELIKRQINDADAVFRSIMATLSQKKDESR